MITEIKYWGITCDRCGIKRFVYSERKPGLPEGWETRSPSGKRYALPAYTNELCPTCAKKTVAA